MQGGGADWVMAIDPSPVLVVGAGPVGLTMANELARHGVRCRVIDRAAGRAAESRALAIFPRTLEVFETMGLAERFLAAGNQVRGLSLRHRDEGDRAR
jgi:2-polyprenyl-6-methoxyphenol hydroxylase-like FAD-dependent oxidoreductase